METLLKSVTEEAQGKPHAWKSMLLITTVVLLASCAKENPSQPQAQTSGTTTDGVRVTPSLESNLIVDQNDFWSQHPGASVPFYPDTLETMNEYVMVAPLNNPSNFRAYFRFRNEGNGRWGGEVWIGYYDTGRLYTGKFTTQSPTGRNHNQVSYRDWYRGLPNSEFNQWFIRNGKRVFHGFFQDPYGAIVVVFDGGISQNDGEPLSLLTGSIWFKNFKRTTAPQFMGGDGEMCWFLLPPSPYECGTFKNSEGRVVTTSSLYPSTADGYKRLGTFGGVSFQRAFPGNN